MDVKNEKEDLTLSSSLTGGVQHAPTLTDDAVFGIISED